MELNFKLIEDAIPLLLAGAGITLEITAMSVGFGLLIGMIIGVARLASIKPVRYAANFYVDFIRGTPLLVQIFLVYFALPTIIGQRIDPFLRLSAPAPSTVVHTLPKFSALAFSPSIKGRWKPGALWG